MSADEKRERKATKGVGMTPEQRDRAGGAVDPTGHVTSGIQTGPLRGGDEAPVAATDEARRRERPARSPGGQVHEGAREWKGDTIREHYPSQKELDGEE